MADRKTLDVYAKRAGDYAKNFSSAPTNNFVRDFLEGVPNGSKLLDLGCGPGNAAAAMISEGHDVDAWDASSAMAEVALETNNLTVTVKGFEDLSAENYYDGIYANFSLLHAAKADMPDHLASIAKALKSGGLFHIGTKTGSGEKRDRLGRFYAYYEDSELTGLLRDAGFTVTSRTTGEEVGLDGTVAPWIIMQARLND